MEFAQSHKTCLQRQFKYVYLFFVQFCLSLFTRRGKKVATELNCKYLCKYYFIANGSLIVGDECICEWALALSRRGDPQNAHISQKQNQLHGFRIFQRKTAFKLVHISIAGNNGSRNGSRQFSEVQISACTYTHIRRRRNCKRKRNNLYKINAFLVCERARNRLECCCWTHQKQQEWTEIYAAQSCSVER